MQRLLTLLGVALLALGVLWPWLAKLGLGRLPGDVVIERGGLSFYFPVTTMILISIVLTVLFRLFNR